MFAYVVTWAIASTGQREQSVFSMPFSKTVLVPRARPEGHAQCTRGMQHTPPDASGCYLWMRTRQDGVLLGRQTKGIPPHGVKYIEALHAPKPSGQGSQTSRNHGRAKLPPERPIQLW